ncbi:MAG: hypothetical protein ACE364_03445 [Chlorobiota bacterium]
MMKDNLIYITVSILILIIGIFLADDYLGDPSIYYIYSKNIAEGFFLNFNKGEFSSGATSPLWALILSIPFLFSTKVIYAKIFSILVAILSHIFFLYFLNRYSKLIVFNLALFCTVSYYTLINGIMSYETSLLLIFIPLMIDSILKNKRLLFFISICLLPLVRPDALVISIMGFGVFIISENEKNKSLIYFILSLLPFIIYISYSYFLTGTYSSSSYCRSFALAEEANSIFGFKYSLATVFSFVSFPAAFLLLFQNKKPKTGIDKLTLVSLIIYLIVFSFIKPIANHPERYLAPIFILLSINAVVLINGYAHKLRNSYKIIFLTITILSSTMIIIKVVKYNNSYTSSEVLEYDLAQFINEIEKNSKILTYEVQSRYFIEDRHEVISMDGIIDGKVAPYLENSELIQFINRYKPDYWIANDAVNYRNYLSNSKLNIVYNDNSIKVGESIIIDNVKFELVVVNQEDLGQLANWKKIYKIEYLDK